MRAGGIWGSITFSERINTELKKPGKQISYTSFRKNVIIKENLT